MAMMAITTSNSISVNSEHLRLPGNLKRALYPPNTG
jgi:hypothetical protein